MDNLYLKDVEITDKDILIEYNNDFKNEDKKGWINEDRLVSFINELKSSLDDNTKVHFYPCFLMKEDKAVGLVILKDNIEVDNNWKNYGGNISYVIAPSYRRLGYGTKALNLALKRCQELGIKNALVTCNVNNIGSRKVIENNYGILNDVCIDEFDDNKQLIRRYIIDVDKSLDMFLKK